MPSTAPAPRFCGSYAPSDVDILLQPLSESAVPLLDASDLVAKERLLQSGQCHYGSLLSRETPPSPEYLALFYAAVTRTQPQMARLLLDLAAIIAAQRVGQITLISLLRAGLPLGVLLKRILTQHFHRQVAHYAVSILRDRGLDTQALRVILDHDQRPAASVAFVDGWIGKGMIAATLTRAVTAFNQNSGRQLAPHLFALTDLAGAGIAPTDADCLIPTCLLNATVAGLISRSVAAPDHPSDALHTCVTYPQFAAQDVSRWWINVTDQAVTQLVAGGYQPNATPVDPQRGRERIGEQLANLTAQCDISDLHRVKIGLGEATRVLQRRLPERVLVRDPASADLDHLRYLAQRRAVTWQ
ncbi:hypothetical protein HUK38_10920, partial [Thiospirillum jenense]|nr:hypothetical protein [Thiospirillum jenense]